jgi:hypothetical protein
MLKSLRINAVVLMREENMLTKSEVFQIVGIWLLLLIVVALV